MPADAPTAPVVGPIAMDARGLAVRLSVSLRTVRTWDATGKLPAATPIGGRKLWSVAEVEDWFRAGSPGRREWEIRKAARK